MEDRKMIEIAIITTFATANRRDVIRRLISPVAY